MNKWIVVTTLGFKKYKLVIDGEISSVFVMRVKGAPKYKPFAVFVIGPDGATANLGFFGWLRIAKVFAEAVGGSSVTK